MLIDQTTIVTGQVLQLIDDRVSLDTGLCVCVDHTLPLSSFTSHALRKES